MHMPKKSAARSGAQRKPKAQKSIELVRPTSIADEERSEAEAEKQEVKAAPASVATATNAEKERSAEPVEQAKAGSTSPKGSAAARLAAQRVARQKAQQRSAATLITPEHFAYVQRDLITVAVLAVVMIAIILISYYMLVVRA
jgi:hypothetical protein